jgi:DNA polymerase epsilon subunit 1
VKRNGELQLIKIFQSSVFEAFLKGNTLDECYDSVAKIADYWLDVLYTKAKSLPDYELFELIAEKRTMSKTLEEYGGQKSTSISTAKRLAEFLGDEMVKDKGLNCKYIISKKPEGAPVAERAIPLAIFQAEASVCKHYLKKWLKAHSIAELEIREFLDWEYYIERLNGCIQKIITIPAALQGVSNPVPRVLHPDWLHKRLSERDSASKQRRIDDMFAPRPAKSSITTTITSTNNNQESSCTVVPDIEDITDSASKRSSSLFKTVTITTQKPTSLSSVPKPTMSNISNVIEVQNKSVAVKRKHGQQSTETATNRGAYWKEILGQAPKYPTTQAESDGFSNEFKKWHAYQKRKWLLQMEKRRELKRATQLNASSNNVTSITRLSDFVQKSANTKIGKPWQIVRISEAMSNGSPMCGYYKCWIVLDSADMYSIYLKLNRRFYVNQYKPAEKESSLSRKVNSKHLPRSQLMYNLYEYSIPEHVFQKHQNEIVNEFANPNVEGVYELNTPLMFGLLSRIGCVCTLKKNLAFKDFDTFDANELEPLAEEYLVNSCLKTIYLFVHFK